MQEILLANDKAVTVLNSLTVLMFVRGVCVHKQKRLSLQLQTSQECTSSHIDLYLKYFYRLEVS